MMIISKKRLNVCHNNSHNGKIFLLLSLIFLYTSCKEDRQNSKLSNNVDICLVFPDTVYINELNDGKINYKSDFDTITTSLEDITKARFLEYTFLTTNNKNYNVDILKTIVKDTFLAETYNRIPLYNIKFNKLGQNYIDGIIKDEIWIENGGKLKNGKLGTRILTKYFRLSKKVMVIEPK